MVNWLEDLTRAYRRAFPDDKDIVGRGELPGAFYLGLTHVLNGDLGAVDFVHFIEHGDKPGFLIVQGERAWIGSFTPPDTTDLLFLGEPRYGRYSEHVIVNDKMGGEIEAKYEHRRLGRDAALIARILSLPPGTLTAHTTSDTDYAVERGAQLRQTLRRWAMGEVDSDS